LFSDSSTAPPETTSLQNLVPESTDRPSITSPPVLQTTVPQTPTTLPQTTAPQTTVLPTTVPQTTAPPTTAPQTTVPPTTVPQTTAPTTVPQTSPPLTTANQLTSTQQVTTTTSAPCDYSQFDTGHTMLMAPNTGCSPNMTGVTDSEKAVILKAHNNLRAKVAKGLETQGDPGPQPAGANIRELVWNNELATVAQAWASQCPNGHDCYNCRKICSGNYAVGQNIYYSWNFNASSEWQATVQSWYDEVVDFPNTGVASFTSGSPSGKAIGHYTQVVWGESNEIGCGAIHYSTVLNGVTYPQSKIYVCNYGKAGNFLNQPLYTQGPAASQCLNGVSTTYPDLCA
ncbi:Peptidase inhibitor 16, partial [Halocaridina rubra]